MPTVRFLRNIEEDSDGFTLNEYSSDMGHVFGSGYNLPDTPNVTYSVLGVKKDDAELGEILNITWYEEVVPEVDIKEYLLTLKGMTESLAKKIKEIDDLKDPKRLSKKTKFQEDEVFIPCADFARRTYGKDFFNILSLAGVKPVNGLHVFLEASIEDLKENPWRFIGYNKLSFTEADKVAKQFNLPKDSAERLTAAVNTVLKDMESGSGPFKSPFFPSNILESLSLESNLYNIAKKGQIQLYSGSTCLPIDIAWIAVMRLIEEPIPKKTFLKGVVGNGNVFTQDGHLYPLPLANAEYSAAKKIAELLNQDFSLKENIYEIVYNAEAIKGIKLSLEQSEAVRTALQNPVSIITGGPGTGKTSVQKVLIEAFQNISLDPILLLSPTGKASKRMTESTGLPASTIHKAIGLGYSGEARVERDLNAGLIIVDESSMIDAKLLNRLVEKIPNNVRLVFVGDIDQLPSVGAGDCLNSLIKSGKIPVSRLTITFRQGDGSNIADDAARIKRGNPNILYANDVQFVETEEIAKTVASEYDKAVKRDGIENVCCLTAFRQTTDTGSNKLNALLRDTLYGESQKKRTFIDGIAVYEGDRIMFTQNALGLVNGDIGIVKEIKRGALICEFDDQKVTIQGEYRKALEPAYALTVHKSQGSEYKTVILVMDMKHKRMLKRNLVYTGVTRAKENLVFVGQKEAFETAVLTKDSGTRKTLLPNLIHQYVSSL